MTLKRHRVEVEEVEDDAISLNDEQSTNTDTMTELDTTIDSKEDLTPKDKLGKCQTLSDYAGFAHIRFQCI